MTGILNLLAGAVSSVVKDTYFNLVSLLLPGDGTNGAQNNTFLDSSTNNFTITRNGNTTQGSYSPFSQTGWSNFFTAASSQTIGFANNNAFKFSAPSGNANDFVVEFFVYPTTTSISIPVGTGYTSGTTYWNFGLNRTSGGANSAGQVQFYLTDNFGLQATSGLNANQWNHICAVRTGTTVSLFVNGTRGATATSSVDPNPTGSLYVAGDAVSLGRYLDGYVSNVRIIKGSTLPYDATQSSITVPTAQLSAVTGTTVLTCQSSRFIDNSTNAFAITTSGTPSVQAFSPFLPTAAYSAATVGGSVYFDGTGDSLVTPSITIGTNAFCFECWLYPTATQGNPGPGIFVATTSNGLQCSYYQTTGLGIAIKGVAWQITSTGLPIVGQWNHVAFVRSGTGTNQTSIFLNGTRVANGTVTTNYSAAAYSLSILDVDFSPFLGYVSGARLTNGSTPYDATQSTLTIPTAPPTTSASNTALLLNFTNAGITDATAKNDLETVGNAQISTTQSKFGGSSMYFDGTGDWLIVPNNAFYNFGSSDFTIEFWWYPNTTADQNLISKWNSGTEWILQWRNAGNFRWAANGSVVRDATYTLSTGAWIHIAVSCASGNLRIFVNGTQIGTTATQSSISATTEPVVIGAGQLSSTPAAVNGYFDDVRITRFARYTANFTAPTSAFALQ